MDTLVRPSTPQVTPAGPAVRGRQPLGWVLVGAALVMVPWLCFLGTSLPTTAQAGHWNIAWVGLDSLEALGLASTGLLLLRRDARRCLAAAMTAVLLVVDAWFDVTTSAPGADQFTSIAMALGAELPLAAVLCTLAFRAFPRT